MDDWEKQQNLELVKRCIRYGDFTLHSGQKSGWVCDLLLVQRYFPSFLASLKPTYPVVGIELGGLLLSQPGGAFIRKDGSYYSNGYQPIWVSLLDDVVTTEQSMSEASLALDKLGIEVREYLCVLDRRSREHRILEIRSLVTAIDLEAQDD